MRVEAQSFPSRPITFVVPAAPGGVTDLIARAIGQRLTENLGQPVIVEDKPGANNQIAAEIVAHAANDGYTLLISPEATFVINPYLYAKLPYDADKDFVPVSGLIKIHHALITHPSLPAKNVADLIALAKKEPGALNYGTYGLGSTGHLNMEMFEARAGVKLTPVHYKGAAPAMTDVIGGQIQMMFVSAGSAVQPAKAGQVNMLAFGGLQRLPSLANVPTIAESGLPGFEALSWFAMWAPAGTPPAIVDKLNAQAQGILADPAFRAKVMDPQFFEPIVGSPAQFADFIKKDAEKWQQVVRKAGITVQ
ncbi:MAG TPA: tripartite tricarboxylate transporter substrate binding protein [Xanthobacteraceae bacterium]|jgi:tripartite-type tricarboxylate transporter receptor subunit TctC|nr:tripartite tricarboxylate transporter substrate binding protein [Xanthobacteraceae bacterium]